MVWFYFLWRELWLCGCKERDPRLLRQCAEAGIGARDNFSIRSPGINHTSVGVLEHDFFFAAELSVLFELLVLLSALERCLGRAGRWRSMTA
jgi:hypothetical protein